MELEILQTGKAFQIIKKNIQIKMDFGSAGPENIGYVFKELDVSLGLNSAVESMPGVKMRTK